MTTDAFTTAARAEGRVRADEWMEKNGGPQTTGHHIAHTSIISGFRQGAEWAREHLAAQAPKPIPDESEMEVVGEWLVVRNVQEPEYPAGPEYGPYPYSDAAPLVHLARVAGFPPEPQETTDAEVKSAALVLLADYQSDYSGGHLEEFLDLARAALTAARRADA